MLKTIDLNRDFVSERGVKVMTATPQPTEHLHVDDPRTVSATG